MGIIADSLDRVIAGQDFGFEDVVLAHTVAPASGPDDHKPEWTADRYHPTLEDQAYQLGFEMGLAGDGEPDLPPSAPGSTWRALLEGWLAGHNEAIDREWAGRQEYEAWLDSIAAPEDSWPEAEMVEARGCLRARRPGRYA